MFNRLSTSIQASKLKKKPIQFHVYLSDNHGDDAFYTRDNLDSATISIVPDSSGSWPHKCELDKDTFPLIETALEIEQTTGNTVGGQKWLNQLASSMYNHQKEAETVITSDYTVGGCHYREGYQKYNFSDLQNDALKNATSYIVDKIKEAKNKSLFLGELDLSKGLHRKYLSYDLVYQEGEPRLMRSEQALYVADVDGSDGYNHKNKHFYPLSEQDAEVLRDIFGRATKKEKRELLKKLDSRVTKSQANKNVNLANMIVNNRQNG